MPSFLDFEKPIAELQGRIDETRALFEEAKAGNPGYRESILVELEAVVRWLDGGYAVSAEDVQTQ